jgi:putative phosphoesterase
VNAVALISDIHSNLVALDAVLADIAASGLTRIVCLGDIVDLGPQPGATVARLRERGIPCVQGNHDLLHEPPQTARLSRIEAWTREELNPDARAFLDALPSEIVLDLEGTEVLCVHGSPRSFRDPFVAATPEAEVAEWARERRFDVLACGHTHVPLTRFHGAKVLVNTGSVGMPFAEPFNGHPPSVLPYSDYAIVRARRDGSGGANRIEVEHRRLPLDVPALRASFGGSSFPEAAEWLKQWD